MARTGEGDLSPSGAAVLGLLMEEPDSAAGLEARLGSRFTSAQWSHSAAHSAIRSLLKAGYIIEADEGVVELSAAAGDVGAVLSFAKRVEHAHTASEGLGASRRYEVTEAGLKVFRTWVCTAPALPTIREELRLKIAFSTPRDAPRLIEMIEAEEEQCRQQFALRHLALEALEQTMSDDGFRSARNWSLHMMVGLLRDEAAIWGDRETRHERFREYIEALGELARRTPSPGPVDT